MGKKTGTPRKKAAKASSGDQVALKVGREVWPLERDVLFRPDRLKYVRKLVKTEGCVFCLASKNGPSFESLCIFQTEHSMIVLNKFPYNSGHLLILPKRHVGDLLKLSEIEYIDLMALVRESMATLQDTYQPGGMNMGLNHGATAGAGIPDHLHFHLIPRWAGDLNFFPLVADTKVVVETLEQTWDRLNSRFQAKSKRRKK